MVGELRCWKSQGTNAGVRERWKASSVSGFYHPGRYLQSRSQHAAQSNQQSYLPEPIIKSNSRQLRAQLSSGNCTDWRASARFAPCKSRSTTSASCTSDCWCTPLRSSLCGRVAVIVECGHTHPANPASPTPSLRHNTSRPTHPQPVGQGQVRHNSVLDISSSRILSLARGPGGKGPDEAGQGNNIKVGRARQGAKM